MARPDDTRRWGLALLAVLAAAGCRATPTPAPPPEPDGQRAFADLVAQVDCGPRVPGTPAWRCGQEHILHELRRSAGRVATQAFTLPDPYAPDSLQLLNLLGHFHPERPRRVLLGAHYDSRPRADQDSGAARDLPVPGANDGASGVAVLLEVARSLSVWDPGVGVDLVFFDGEDYGKEGDHAHYLLGSRHFVRTMGAYRPIAMFLVDMVGERGARIPMEANSWVAARDLTQLVFAVADSLQVRTLVAEPGPAVLDDHVPFLQAGIPAVDLIDIEYPEWHTLRDLPDRCAPEPLADVCRVLLHTLARLGRAE